MECTALCGCVERAGTEVLWREYVKNKVKYIKKKGIGKKEGCIHKKRKKKEVYIMKEGSIDRKKEGFSLKKEGSITWK